MKGHLLVVLACLPCLISGWKPISHPAAFTVHQTFPALGSEPTNLRKASNEVIQSDSVDGLLASFNHNEFGDDASASSLDDYGSEGRIVNFGSDNKFNGLVGVDVSS